MESNKLQPTCFFFQRKCNVVINSVSSDHTVLLILVLVRMTPPSSSPRVIENIAFDDVILLNEICLIAARTFRRQWMATPWAELNVILQCEGFSKSNRVQL